MEDKAKLLRKYKTLATGLFIIMAVIFLLMNYLGIHYDYKWIGYVKAFSEAAMVGALADWFAVTALFNYPLGLKIPHTNLIENSKKSIGDNLGGFVVENFLNSSTIRPYIEQLKVASKIPEAIKSEKAKKIIVNEVAHVIKDVIVKLDHTAITTLLTKKVGEVIYQLPLQQWSAKAITYVIAQNKQNHLIDFLLDKVGEYVGNNHDVIKNKVKEQSHILIPGFVDNIIAQKITHALENYLIEIRNDENHQIRQDITARILEVAAQIESKPSWKADIDQLITAFVENVDLEQYINDAYQHIQAGIIKDIDDENSKIRFYIEKYLNELIHNIETDVPLQEKIDHWLQVAAYRLINKNSSKVGDVISDTVGNWEGKMLSQKLELEVGKDLQFIRINGTLVGGIVGLLIYTITQIIFSH